jgi:hypothetical protein
MNSISGVPRRSPSSSRRRPLCCSQWNTVDPRRWYFKEIHQIRFFPSSLDRDPGEADNSLQGS